MHPGHAASQAVVSAVQPYASTFARLALHNITQEYPNKPDHVLNSAAEALPPRALHPVFYGSYDWHSSVHMHWLLVRLLRCFPQLPEAGQVASLLDAHFSETGIAGEIAYLTQPSRQHFERSYGWAWLLKLQVELANLASVHPRGRAWCKATQPLADMFVARYLDFLPHAQYPIRSGTHANSAFGLLFALDYAEQMGHAALRSEVVARAQAWFGKDRRYPAAYEPGGDDFLSAGLMEAVLMLRVLGEERVANWWDGFCPDEDGLMTWLSPVRPSDRSDPKLAHLDGLNLSRAWCWKTLLRHLPENLQGPVRRAVDDHLKESLPHACAGHYAGTHWLASFALLALGQD